MASISSIYSKPCGEHRDNISAVKHARQKSAESKLLANIMVALFGEAWLSVLRQAIENVLRRVALPSWKQSEWPCLDGHGL